MVTRNFQHSQPFDALAFEEERFEIFEKVEAIPEAALNADWDARLGEKPTHRKWHDPVYRAAYLEAIANKLDEKYGLI